MDKIRCNGYIHHITKKIKARGYEGKVVSFSIDSKLIQKFTNKIDDTTFFSGNEYLGLKKGEWKGLSAIILQDVRDKTILEVVGVTSITPSVDESEQSPENMYVMVAIDNKHKYHGIMKDVHESIFANIPTINTIYADIDKSNITSMNAHKGFSLDRKEGRRIIVKRSRNDKEDK